MLKSMSDFADPNENPLLIADVCDEALEAAADRRAGPAITFLGATVSVLIACCSNEIVKDA